MQYAALAIPLRFLDRVLERSFLKTLALSFVIVPLPSSAGIIGYCKPARSKMWLNMCGGRAPDLNVAVDVAINRVVTQSVGNCAMEVLTVFFIRSGFDKCLHQWMTGCAELLHIYCCFRWLLTQSLSLNLYSDYSWLSMAILTCITRMKFVEIVLNFIGDL